MGMECIASGHPEVIVHCNQINSPYNGYMGYVLVEDLAKEMIKAIKNRDIFILNFSVLGLEKNLLFSKTKQPAYFVL